MKYLTTLSLIALMTALLFSCSKDIPVGSQNDVLSDVKVNSIEDPFTAKETLDIINEYRTNNGLTPLQQHSIISKEASDHTDYMIYRDQVSHDYFYEREAYLKEKLSAVEVAENVAYAYNSASAVLNAWLKSDVHKKNLNGGFTHYGISVKKNAEGRLFYTSIFVKQ